VGSVDNDSTVDVVSIIALAVNSVVVDNSNVEVSNIPSVVTVDTVDDSVVGSVDDDEIDETAVEVSSVTFLDTSADEE